MAKDGWNKIKRKVAYLEAQLTFLHFWKLITGFVTKKFRSIRHLTALSELIASFPTANQLNAEMLELLEKIRAKYKAIMAILKVGNNQKFKQETESSRMAY